jgi:RNA polymerase-binding transcription factor DksA
MSDAELLTILQQELQQLLGRLENLKKDAEQSHSNDFSEQAQERENDEVVDSLGNETLTMIRDTRAAIERIEAGEYGSCQRCGEAIQAARLAARPTTPYCVSCASQLE